MLLMSVTATAGIPALATALISGLTRTRPSTRENSVCRRRWTNEAVMAVPYKTQKRQGGDCTAFAAASCKRRTTDRITQAQCRRLQKRSREAAADQRWRP